MITSSFQGPIRPIPPPIQVPLRLVGDGPLCTCDQKKKREFGIAMFFFSAALRLDPE